MNVFLGYQKIYDYKLECVAYEVLYRNSNENFFDNQIEENEATLQVIHNLMLMGHLKFLEGKKAFLNFPKECILDEVPEMLSNKIYVIEILEDVVGSKEIVEKIKKLKNLGYTIALDDVTHNDNYKPFREYIDIYKIDFLSTSKEERKILLNEIKRINPKAKFLAEKIETEEDFLEGKENGYTYFQGYFLNKPQVVKENDISSNDIVYYKLIKELFSDNTDLDKVENIIKGDIALSFKLIKFLNVGKFETDNKISSIREAIDYLELNELRKWVSLVLINSIGTVYNKKLSINSIIRGKFCESISHLIDKKNKSRAFIVGLFSFLDIFMDKKMNEIIEQLPLDLDINESLIYSGSNLNGKILKLVKFYEKMDTQNIIKVCEEIGINPEDLFSIYDNSLNWSMELIEKN